MIIALAILAAVSTGFHVAAVMLLKEHEERIRTLELHLYAGKTQGYRP